LRSKFADRQGSWNRAARKATRWLSQTLGVTPEQVEAWLSQLAGAADGGRKIT